MSGRNHIYRRVTAVALAVILCISVFPATTFAASHSVKTPGKVTVRSVRQSASTVTIKWKKVKKNVTGYQIYQRVNKGSWKRLKTVSRSASRYKTKVKYGKKYQFKVRAINRKKVGKKTKTKYGKFSKVKSVKTYSLKSILPGRWSKWGTDWLYVFKKNGTWYAPSMVYEQSTVGTWKISGDTVTITVTDCDPDSTIYIGKKMKFKFNRVKRCLEMKDGPDFYNPNFYYPTLEEIMKH